MDSLGYTRFRHWKAYGEEALAGREAALWLAAESLTAEQEGEPPSRYEVRIEMNTGELWTVAGARLFALDSFGEGDWLKAMRLEGYTPRAPRPPLEALQQALFPYAEAL